METTPSIIYSFLILLLFAACSQKTTPPEMVIPANAPSIDPRDTMPFPQSWEGIWTGELNIHSGAGKQRSLPMELHILPIDTSENHIFSIIYGEDKVEGLRPYELVTIDAAKGLYAVDEKNSIQMEAYLLGNSLVQRFEVMGNMLMTINEKRGDEIIWTIFSGSLTPVSTTGEEIVDGEEIPEVKAYPMKVMQRAVLRRSN